MTLTLESWNRAVNQAYPLANEVLAATQEGKPGYDCKGFCALKAHALHHAGYAWDRLTCLTVPGSSPTEHHMVLRYRPKPTSDAAKDRAKRAKKAAKASKP
jgi:predicted transglutaminase-like cysteine proteinase